MTVKLTKAEARALLLMILTALGGIEVQRVWGKVDDSDFAYGLTKLAQSQPDMGVELTKLGLH